jgi:hypothetical protein
MRKLIKSARRPRLLPGLLPALFPGLFLVLSTSGCTGVDRDLHNTVVLHYQHVANVHRIELVPPVALPHRAPVHAVLPLAPDGFWAVFVLCGLDVTGATIPSFYFDVDRLRVAYGAHRYGPLRPYTLRLDDTADVNGRADTPRLAEAIAAELQRGPSSQVFRHGYHADPGIRVAIHVPAAPSDYAGGPLTLRYEGGQVLALGNDVPPADIGTAGPSGSGIAAHCLP